MRFFFYSTLAHEHDNAVTRQVLPLLGHPRRGYVRGVLHAVSDPRGCYPLMVPGAGWVQGWLYPSGPRFGHAALRLLDRYEGREYRRRLVRVRLDGGGTAQAFAYIANRPLHAGLARIPGGDFPAWSAARAKKVFGG